LAKLLDYLKLSNETDLSSEFHKIQFAGKHYDPNAKLAEFQTVRNDRHDEWQKFFSNPLRKRWARHYVEWIGQERLAQMGYDLDNILDELNATPATLNLVANDAYWMSFGFFFRLFNGRMLRNNVRRWRAREKFWGYR
jgi:hypothetical protein